MFHWVVNVPLLHLVKQIFKQFVDVKLLSEIWQNFLTNVQVFNLGNILTP